jgi:hypothetical protein
MKQSDDVAKMGTCIIETVNLHILSVNCEHRVPCELQTSKLCQQIIQLYNCYIRLVHNLTHCVANRES